MRDNLGRMIIPLEDIVVAKDTPAWAKYGERFTPDGYKTLVDFCDPTDRYYRATVWHSGCIDLRCISNGCDWDGETAEEDCDYIHICEIDDMIGRLQALREEAIKHFGPDWNTGKFRVVMLPKELHGPALQALKNRK